MKQQNIMGTIRNKSGLVRSRKSDLMHDYYAVNSVDGLALAIRKKVVSKRDYQFQNTLLKFVNLIHLKLKWKTLNWRLYWLIN